jgi:hypothetical protein
MSSIYLPLLNTMTAEKPEKHKKITPLSFMGSIIAAWFGVQSKTNRERDFEHGKFHHFVFGGIIFAVLFILFVVGIVKVVMHFALA